MPDERSLSEILDGLREKEYQEILSLGEDHPDAAEYDALAARRDEIVAANPESAASILEFVFRNSHDQKLLRAATVALVPLSRQSGFAGKAIELTGLAMQKVEDDVVYEVLEATYHSAMFSDRDDE